MCLRINVMRYGLSPRSLLALEQIMLLLSKVARLSVTSRISSILLPFMLSCLEVGLTFVGRGLDGLKFVLLSDVMCCHGACTI